MAFASRSSLPISACACASFPRTSLQPTLPDLDGAGSAWIGDSPAPRSIPTRPYLVRLDEGRSIAVFFYDGPISRAIAFEGLLNSGENFAMRLTGGFDPNSD